jgi:hypothetical protein
MVFAYTCCLVVIVGRFVEFILNLLYTQISHFFSKPSRERKDPSYKRLSADVSIEFHQEVSEMASKKSMTLKEYILGAVMMRLKLDKAE